MFDFIGEKISGIDVTKEQVSSRKNGRRCSLLDPWTLLSRIVPYESPYSSSQRKMMPNFLLFSRARSHPSKEEEQLHVPSILRLQVASPINADTGAHHTTSPSYANYEPPWELNVRLFCVHPYTEQVEKQHERAKCESSARARAPSC